MAIRRGGMQTPTAASDVFEPIAYTGDGSTKRKIGGSISQADLVIVNDRQNDSSLSSNSTGAYVWDRIRGENLALVANSGSAESSGWANDYFNFDESGGWRASDSANNYLNKNSSTYISWAWKRARGYFDVVPYTGTGSDRTVNHNLHVAPEMIWAKRRNNNGDWVVYHAGVGNDKGSKLNTTDAFGSEDYWNSTDPTASVFTLGGGVNDSSVPYISYLFATAAGVSKVGSFTQSGATNVACGFTGDTPSFILLKRTDSTGDWLTFDSARGIVAGNDPSLDLNNADAEVTNADVVDPYSGGFATTSTLTNGDYIFYAIAATS